MGRRLHPAALGRRTDQRTNGKWKREPGNQGKEQIQPAGNKYEYEYEQPAPPSEAPPRCLLCSNYEWYLRISNEANAKSLTKHYPCSCNAFPPLAPCSFPFFYVFLCFFRPWERDPNSTFGWIPSLLPLASSLLRLYSVLRTLPRPASPALPILVQKPSNHRRRVAPSLPFSKIPTPSSSESRLPFPSAGTELKKKKIRTSPNCIFSFLQLILVIFISHCFFPKHPSGLASPTLLVHSIRCLRSIPRLFLSGPFWPSTNSRASRP